MKLPIADIVWAIESISNFKLSHLRANLIILINLNALRALTAEPDPLEPELNYRPIYTKEMVTTMKSNILNLSDTYPFNPKPVIFIMASNKNIIVKNVFKSNNILYY